MADITLAEWRALTPKQAARRVASASSAECTAALMWSVLGTDEAERAWKRAFAYWENLRVLALCGERAADPYQTES